MPDPKKKKTRMLKGTTIFGKTIPEIKKSVRDLSKPLSETPMLKQMGDAYMRGLKRVSKGIVTGVQEHVGKKKTKKKN